MKQILTSALLTLASFIYSQQPALINEDFYQKMMNLNLAWTDFDMPTKIYDHEGRFSAYQCKYYSDAKPAKSADCTRGMVQIDVCKAKHTPNFEFPELPTCKVLRLGVQAGEKGKVCGLAIERLDNENWVKIDETEIDIRQKCFFWEPKNIQSSSPVKYRLIANKAGNVYLTNVYAE